MRKWSVITVIGSGLVVGLLIFLSHWNTEPNPTGDDLVAPGDPPSRPSGAGLTAGADVGLAPSNGEPPTAVASTSSLPRVWEGGAWRAGVRAFEAGDYVTARAALEDAVRESDGVAYRHYLLGLTYLRLEQPDAAAMQLEVAREQAPDNVRVLVNLARARLQLEDPSAAGAVLMRALELDSLDADAHLVTGRVQLVEGDAAAAAASFARAAELSPAQAWAWNNLGYARILRERFAAAVDPLRTATRLRDDQPLFFNNLGVALERTGDLAGAHAAYARASSLGHTAAVASCDRVDALLIAQGLDPLHLPDSLAIDPVAAQTGDSLEAAPDLTTAARR